MNSETSPLLLLLSGPAGSGKTTLCDRVPREMQNFSRVITATTRTPRPGEVNGVHYHFLSPDEFRLKISYQAFLEWSVVHGTDHDDRLYGTLAESVLEPLSKGQDLIMNMDVQGAKKLREAAKISVILRNALVTVFIGVSPEEQARRMHGRGHDHPDEIARRMETAKTELCEAKAFDFIIESKTPGEDFASIKTIIRHRRLISAV
jgi:guanylate kinase